MNNAKVTFISISWPIVFLALLITGCSQPRSSSDIGIDVDSEDFDVSQSDADILKLDSVVPNDQNSQPDSGDGIVLSLENVDLGWVTVGRATESDITLTNGTLNTTRIFASRQPGWDQDLSVELVGNNPVEAGATITIKIKWNPTQESEQIGEIASIVITDDKSEVLGNIRVTGGATTPTLVFIPNEVVFNSSSTTSPLVHSLTVKNTGKVPFTLLSADTDCSDFLTETCQHETCPLTVVTDESEPVTITLLNPNEFLNLKLLLEVPIGPGCNQNAMKVNIATDIRPEPYSVNISFQTAS